MWSATISVGAVGAVAAVAVMSRHIKINYDFICAYLGRASYIQSILNRLTFFSWIFRWTMQERWATEQRSVNKKKITNSNEKCCRISIIILNQHQTCSEYDRLCCEHVLWMNSHGKSVGKPIWIYLGIKPWKVSTGGTAFVESILHHGIYIFNRR